MKLSLKPRLFCSALAVAWLVIAQLACAGDAAIEGGAADNSEQVADDAPAIGSFFDRKGEGWFWYKDPKEKKPTKPLPATPAPAASQPKKDEPFSVAWLRKNLPIFREHAIDSPTKENIETYMYAQRVAMDKSQNFAEATQRVVYADPFLDENNRVPLSSFAKPAFLLSVDKSGNEALNELAKTGGLWLFFDSKCDYCKVQAHILKQVAKKHGFLTKFISLDGKGIPEIPAFVQDNGYVAKLSMRVTPTTVLVVPPNTYLIISQGMMSADQLEERILVAAESQNLLSPDLAAKVAQFSRGVLKTEDLQNGAGEDPAIWIKTLKERLKGRY
jgi:conjugal transfer pilus assembly protein TraF